MRGYPRKAERDGPTQENWSSQGVGHGQREYGSGGRGRAERSIAKEGGIAKGRDILGGIAQGTWPRGIAKQGRPNGVGGVIQPKGGGTGVACVYMLNPHPSSH